MVQHFKQCKLSIQFYSIKVSIDLSHEQREPTRKVEMEAVTNDKVPAKERPPSAESEAPKIITSPEMKKLFVEGDPYYQNYVTLMDAGFSPELSKLLILNFDKIARDRVNELTNYYLAKQEYDSILKIYHSGTDRFHADSMAIQKGHFENVRQHYDQLKETFESVRGGIMEQVKALESGLQLDINLEKKKVAESTKVLMTLADEAEKDTYEKLNQVLIAITRIGQQSTLLMTGNFALDVVSFSKSFIS